MTKKSIPFIIINFFIVISLIPIAIAITPESLLETYLDFYGWFDFFIYLIIFTAVSKLALEAVFKKTGEESKAISLLYTGLGLLFSLSLVTWEIKSGFYLFQLGPLIIVLLLILILAWLWKWIKSRKKGEKGETRPTIRYIALFLLILITALYVLFPQVLYYGLWSAWIQEALAILAIICFLIILFSYIGKEEIKEKLESRWQKRRLSREEAKRLKKELKAKGEAERAALEAEREREKQRLELEEARRKAQIEGIGKIECYIRAYSQLQNKVLVDGDRVSINDRINLYAVINNSSNDINYNWLISGHKEIRTRSVDIYARRLGEGKKKIELFVIDNITGHKSKNSIILFIRKELIEKRPPKEKIRLRPLKIKIIKPAELIRRGVIQKGEIIKLGFYFPERKPERYEVVWIVGGTRIREETPVINTEHYFKKPGPKKIVVWVRDSDIGDRASDEIIIDLIIPGVQRRTITQKAVEKVKQKAIEKVKQTPGFLSKLTPSKIINWRRKKRIAKNTKNLLKNFESLVNPFEVQRSYIKSVHDDIKETLPPKVRIRPGGEQYLIELLENTKGIEILIQKRQDEIYKILSSIIKEPDRRIRDNALAIRATSERLRFKELSATLKTDIINVTDRITTNINNKNLTNAYNELTELLNVLNYRTETIHNLISKTKELITYVEPAKTIEEEIEEEIKKEPKL